MPLQLTQNQTRWRTQRLKDVCTGMYEGDKSKRAFNKYVGMSI